MTARGPGSGQGSGRELAIDRSATARWWNSLRPARRAAGLQERERGTRLSREPGLRGGAPVVAMVESAEARQSHNLCSSVSVLRHRPPRRCRLAEAQVRTVVVVVGDVFAQEPTEMSFVEDDDVVEQFAAHAADPALGNAVLPRAPVSPIWLAWYRTTSPSRRPPPKRSSPDRRSGNVEQRRKGRFRGAAGQPTPPPDGRSRRSEGRVVDHAR